ncbi:MAG TPA: ABC transporter permease [Gemmatimonadaceae bacterium]|jgi:predicted permease
MMRLPRGVRRLLRLPPTRERIIRDVDDEVSLHIDLRTAELRADGMSDDEAHTEAVRRFGDRTEFSDYSDRRASKNARRVGLRASVDAWRQDIHFANRYFRRAPAFTALAVFTLALGIGANAAIFSVVHRLLLSPLPYPDANRIVRFSPGTGNQFPTIAMLREIAARSRTVETVAAVGVVAMAVQQDDGQDTVFAYISPNYLKMLGVAPILGRPFTAAEERGEGAPVAMISDARWQREFAGGANAIGASVEINVPRRGGADRRRFTVVGVTPPTMGLPLSPASFNDNLHEPKPGVWVPRAWSAWDQDDDPHSFARLRPGVSIEQATQELQSIIGATRGAGGKRRTIGVKRAQDMLDTTEARMIEVLFAAVGVLLLIACANVANLLMSRAWTRRREFAVRAALGAGRARLARQVLTESTMLALAGGLLGIAVAWATLRVIVSLRPPTLANLDDVHLEGSALLWIAGISVLTGILFGTLPALFAARGSVADVLRSETRAGSGTISTRRIRSGLIVLEIALSLVLLAGAGLLVRSFMALQRVPLGFEPNGMVSFDVMYNSQMPRALGPALGNQIVERLKAVPGVKDASIGMLPSVAWGGGEPLSTDPDAAGMERSVPGFTEVTANPGYFPIAQIRLLAGRYPDSLTSRTLRPAPAPNQSMLGDHPAAEEVLLNRSTTDYLWPNGGAVGGHVHTGTGRNRRDYTVVGVVEDVHIPGTHQLARSAQMYRLPWFFVLASFVVRTDMPAAEIVPPLRRAILSTPPTPFIQSMAIGEDFLRESLAPTRFAMALLVSFAAVALTLAGVGLYGVIAYGVAQRTREIGVRIALGAEPSAVARLVVGNGLRLAIAGVAIGALASIGATRALSGLIFGVSSTDPLTFIAITIIVGGIALLASYMPARRALKIDPVEALRAD